MDPNEVSIIVKALDGEWETLGSESARYRGTVPENVQFSADQWGSSTCSFDLKRHPGALHPDLAAFTECEIWVAGFKCWSGRVKETPTREGADPVISVQGQGWQYHLDDDLYKRTYVRTRLDGWADMRSTLTAGLAENMLAAAGQVSIDGTALTLTYPSGANYYPGGLVGCYLDLGPEPASWAKYVHATYTTSNNTSGVLGYIRGSNNGPDNVGGWVGSEDITSSSLALSSFGAGPGAWGGTFATARRWVQFFIYFPGGPGATAADHWMRLSAVQVFSDVAWIGGGASVLKADAVVRDAVSRATLKLSEDRSLIAPGTFSIPEFEMSGHQTPREVVTAVNAFENYETKVDVDRRLIFTPRQIAPVYEIGEWSGAEFEDASANSGEEIVNRVIVQGAGAGGEPVSVERWAGGLVPGSFAGISPLANPSGTVDATGWTVNGALTRNTSTFFSSPAALHGQTPGPGAEPFVMEASASASIEPGRRYRLYLQYRPAQIVLVYSVTLKVKVTPSNRVYEKTFDVSYPATAVFAPLVLDFLVPASTVVDTGYTVTISVNRQGTGARNAGFFEDISLSQINTTVVDRQGFVRTRVMPVQNRVTEASATRLGDLYLEQHRTTPFTGGFKATGVGGVRHVLGGTSVHPAWLAKDTGVLVRVGHVIDPDTGNVGRDERIAAVAYDHNSQTATVSLSEDRGGFDALLQRLAAVVK